MTLKNARNPTLFIFYIDSEMYILQLELVLIVEKLQELRSIRIEKLKKQGLISIIPLLSVISCLQFYAICF